MAWRIIQSYLGRTIGLVVSITLVFIFVHFFLVSSARINGESMSPTLSDGESFLVRKTAYFFSAPERLDVVQMMDPQEDGQLLVKRIIGMPGEQINIRGPYVFVVEGEEETLVHTALLSTDTFVDQTVYSVNIPENAYYVLGDNRPVSRDSRDFGPVHRVLINGPLKGVE
jgi:signal peptidase I